MAEDLMKWFLNKFLDKLWLILPIPGWCKILIFIGILLLIVLVYFGYKKHKIINEKIIQPLLYGKDIKLNLNGPLFNAISISRSKGLEYFTSADNYKIQGVSYAWLMPTKERQEIELHSKILPKKIQSLMINFVEEHQKGDIENAYKYAIQFKKWLKKNERLLYYIFCTYKSLQRNVS